MVCVTGWPSGLRRWFKAPVTLVAWVRIPLLSFFLVFDILAFALEIFRIGKNFCKQKNCLLRMSKYRISELQFKHIASYFQGYVNIIHHEVSKLLEAYKVGF